jgi:hypothetical protein
MLSMLFRNLDVQIEWRAKVGNEHTFTFLRATGYDINCATNLQDRITNLLLLKI